MSIRMKRQRTEFITTHDADDGDDDDDE